MKKIIIIVVAIIVGIAALALAIFGIISSKTNKLVCKSKEGNITLMYDEKTIIGYTVVGMDYDLEEQKKIAEKIGIDAYLDAFDLWFRTNTTGTCKR